MKNLLLVLLGFASLSMQAQAEDAMKKHYEAYYRAMRLQGDVQGVINAITHLNVIDPSTARLDTLAYIYSNNNQHMQALNTIGIEKNADDSDLAVRVKAFSLKAINQPKRAQEQFEVLFERNANPYIAYEIADLKIQTGDSPGAMKNIEFGIANANDEMKYAFYERQQPYEVPLKAAFIHLKGLVEYNMDKANIDAAIKSFDEALAIAPNFNLASLSKQALEERKNQAQQESENQN